LSIASIMVVAYIGYESGRRALVESIRSQLSGLCQVKSTSIQNQLRTIKGLVVSLSADETFLHALKDFKKGFDELNEQAIVSSQSSDISVTALEDLEVLVLDPETLNVLIDEMPRLAREIGGLMDIRRKAAQSARKLGAPAR